jgi:hypothetical protein
MHKTYIELLLRSAGERTASAGVRLVSPAARSTAVTLLIRLRILPTYQLPLPNRPPPLGTLRSSHLRTVKCPPVPYTTILIRSAENIGDGERERVRTMHKQYA